MLERAINNTLSSDGLILTQQLINPGLKFWLRSSSDTEIFRSLHILLIFSTSFLLSTATPHAKTGTKIG